MPCHLPLVHVDHAVAGHVQQLQFDVDALDIGTQQQISGDELQCVALNKLQVNACYLDAAGQGPVPEPAVGRWMLPAQPTACLGSRPD